MGPPNCRGTLVFKLTLPNERYATVRQYMEMAGNWYLSGISGCDGLPPPSPTSQSMFHVVTFIVLYNF
jgi:hypothetical protein